MSPFIISRIVFGRGAGLVMPDGPTLLRGHIGFLSWPGSLLLFASFLLGAPVFVVMAGFALLLFFLAGTPIASVPAETFRLVVSPTLPAIPLLTVAGYVVAVLQLAGALFFPFVLFPLWVLVVSIVLLSRESRVEASASTAIGS